MARPSKNRTHRLNLRLTSEERARLEMDAQIAAVELSTFARARIMDGPIPRRARRVCIEDQKHADILIALGRLGTNLNQLAKVANATGNLPAVREIRKAKEALETIGDMVRDALHP